MTQSLRLTRCHHWESRQCNNDKKSSRRQRSRSRREQPCLTVSSIRFASSPRSIRFASYCSTTRPSTSSINAATTPRSYSTSSAIRSKLPSEIGKRFAKRKRTGFKLLFTPSMRACVIAMTKSFQLRFGLRLLDQHMQRHWLDPRKNARHQLKRAFECSPKKKTPAIASVKSRSSTLSNRQSPAADAADSDGESLGGSISEHGGGSAPILSLRFRHFPADPVSQLAEDVTRYELVSGRERNGARLMVITMRWFLEQVKQLRKDLQVSETCSHCDWRDDPC